MPIVQKRKQTVGKTIQHHARHLLVPHKANGWRPHLVRAHGLGLVVIAALIIQIGYGFLTNGRLEVLGRTSNVTVSELLTDTNAERAKAELAPLVISDKLDQAAFMKAKDMFAHNYWAHESPTGVSPWKWLGDVSYNYDVAGENLAKNYVDSTATMAAWMASPTHKANILNAEYQDVGFAIVEDVLGGRETTIIVALYGKAAPGAVAGTKAEQKTYAPIVGGTSTNPLVYFGSAIQSLSPATIGVLGILVIVGVVAAMTHHYRYRLPKRLQKSWKLHHGAYKLAGVGIAVIVIIISTGGGQI